MHEFPIIPGYDLLSCLGGGMMTVVCTARDRATDKLCAVKLIRPGWRDRRTAIKLLHREARASLAVRHPQVVRMRHVHVMKPPYFLVMDLLSGETLRQRLRRDYRLGTCEAVWIGRQVAEALAALHQKGFIHGDLKPDNIFLTGAGNVMLLDLGFAHRPGENAAVLKQGYILGTVDYLAPELCSAAPTDELSGDLFSLGVTLFEMLSGNLPYARGNLRETIQRHLIDSPADLRQYCSGAHPALVKVIRRLLSRKSQERPRSFAVVQQFIALEIAALYNRHAA